MKNIIVLDPNIPDIETFKNSILDNYDIHNYNDISSNLSTILNNIDNDFEKLSFIWEFKGSHLIPFYNHYETIVLPHNVAYDSSENIMRDVSGYILKDMSR